MRLLTTIERGNGYKQHAADPPGEQLGDELEELGMSGNSPALALRAGSAA
ncbi:MAG: hypothetical protein ACREV1_05565 [Gammaproteobacteria bacterium]